VKVVLDAWALIALLRREPAAERVAEAITRYDAHVSSINLGEVLYDLIRSHGRPIAAERVHELRQAIRVEDPDWQLVRDAAEIKAGGGLSFPDAFCVATARRHVAPIYTGDPEIVRLAGEDLRVVDLRSP